MAENINKSNFIRTLTNMNTTQNLTPQQSKDRHTNHNKNHQKKKIITKKKEIQHILLMVWRISSTHSCHWNEIATSRQLYSEVIYPSFLQAVTKPIWN
jgi:chemotaxis signal transduction protein